MSSESGPRLVTVFLASPTMDTLAARAQVVEVAGEINSDPLYAPHVRLELRRWDDPARPVICDRAGNPQQDIVRQLGSPAHCDLVVGIFANTMGGTLPPDRFPPPAGRALAWHCSEWEVEQGLQARRDVWVFHDQRPASSKAPEVLRDSLAVSDYIERCNLPGRPMREGFNRFTDEQDLARRLRTGLRAWLHRRAFVPEAAAAPAAGEPRRQRERRYIDVLRYKRLAQHEPCYVPLAGEEAREQRLERALRHLSVPSEVLYEDFGIEIGEVRAAARETIRYEDVLDAYRALRRRAVARRIAVIGEPGAGKSFSLGCIAAELAREAEEDADRVVPVLAPLGLWTEAEESLNAFLARQAAPLTTEDLDALLAERRLVLLLDGLNEIPPGQRDAKRRQIEAWSHDERLAAMVLSCRERDFEAGARLPFDTLKLLPMRPTQVRDFLQRALTLAHGDGQGERLAEEKFWQIAGGEGVREVWRTWERCGASFKQFWTAEDIPRKDPNVFGGTSREQDECWREARSERGLMHLAGNPYLLSVMMQLPQIPPNRAQLFAGFLSVLHRRELDTRRRRGDVASAPAFETWRAILVEVAEALQRADAGAAGGAGDGVRTALAQGDWPATLDEALLAFSIDASVLQSVDGALRFTHQLLQESLAADVLLQASRTSGRSAADFWPEHRGWARTGWEVVAEIAAEACVRDAEAQVGLIDWLARAAPKVAADVWRHMGRPPLPSGLLDRTAAQWGFRLTDIAAEPDPESRMAIAVWLNALGLDRRPGTGLRHDGVPDIDWVPIADERPFVYQDTQHAPLPAYAISRYPITNRQWQAFIDDGGHGADRWWKGLSHRPQPDLPKWGEATAPRVNVSWYEAVAYSRWLAEKLGRDVSLPTEEQWERAARYVDGRAFPWGIDYLEGHANIREDSNAGGTWLGRTSAVGLYPRGASVEGVCDLAGNVWEWCLNEFERPSRIGTSGKARRVLRGGAWYDDSVNCRAAVRYGGEPGSRGSVIGFRLVVSCPIQNPVP